MNLEEIKLDAACWAAMAGIHQAEGENLLDAGQLDQAAQQFLFAERKLSAARVRITEARELEAMENGS